MLIASFASNIHRVQQAIDVAGETGRRVALVGRSLRKNVNIARNLGYLDVRDDLLVKPDELDLLRPQETMILCTGSQGEPMSALTRMAYHDHPHVAIEEGDTVIISAKPVPGTSCASTTRSTTSPSPARRCCTRRSRRCTSPDTERRGDPHHPCAAPAAQRHAGARRVPHARRAGAPRARCRRAGGQDRPGRERLRRRTAERHRAPPTSSRWGARSWTASAWATCRTSPSATAATSPRTASSSSSPRSARETAARSRRRRSRGFAETDSLLEEARNEAERTVEECLRQDVGS